MKTRRSRHQLINGDQAGQRQPGQGRCASNQARQPRASWCERLVISMASPSRSLTWKPELESCNANRQIETRLAAQGYGLQINSAIGATD